MMQQQQTINEIDNEHRATKKECFIEREAFAH